ncbi:MAG: FHA domain-containing protein [Pirellula sp.]
MFIGRPFSLRIGLHFELPFDGLTIGRGLENDLALPGSLGNRFHCRIFRQGEQYVLKYFETRQCPVYNGKCQWGGEHAMIDGDTFNVANITFRYCDSVPLDPQFAINEMKCPN